MGVIIANVNNNFIVFTLILSQQFQVGFDVARSGPCKHLTMVAGVSSATFLTMELPITTVGFSVSVSLSGENLLETQMGWWRPAGWDLGLCFLRNVTQPV
ncbi:hypothetical protein CHARACLAT_032287 [Characodon lateralis]|uniref:Uncharacterized protein n=1 Tax=Characodon lateralis TaxID=208331 RepID=A0ABU7EHK1_9TELE|nr:hypothetical protein [Characodon lateralis]